MAMIGGVGMTATAVGGALVGGKAVQDAANIELVQARARLERYAQLIALYEQLEKVGIDNIVAAGMNIVRGALDAIQAGVQTVRAGIAAVETAVKNFQTLLESLRGGADAVARAVTDLSQKFKIAEGIVVRVIGVALPLAESIASFFNALLGKIPFVGDDLRRAATSAGVGELPPEARRAVPPQVPVDLPDVHRDAVLPRRGEALEIYPL
jgi:predicted Fe-Mo cluster-binding NifX family protein